MANMSYCRFHNTSMDMRECLQCLEDEEPTSNYECEKAMYMFEDILSTMQDLGIIDEYDGDLLQEYVDKMREE